MLAGKDPGAAIGALSRDQAEIARLRRALEVSEGRLATTEIAVPTAITGCYGQDVPYPGFAQGSGFLTSSILIVAQSGIL